MRFRTIGLWGAGLALAASAVSGQLAGSIRTVDPTAAPQDLFSSKTDVALAVGSLSTPCRNSEALADGDYYFQVTDAAGAHLLSTDPVSERRVTVVNGVIAAYDGSTHVVGGPTACGSLTVSLSPYDDAGDRKVVYVVWMTPVGSFQGQPTDVGPVCGDGCFFGFVPAQSVGHAFRVEDKRNCEPTFCASGTVFSDTNGDGKLGDGETGIGDVAIEVKGPTGIVLSGISAADGTYQVCGLTSSDTWLVNEIPPNGYKQTGPKNRRVSRSLIARDLGYILLVCCSDFRDLDFGNQLIPGAVGGLVYQDANANGARDPGEPSLPGAALTLLPTSPPGDPVAATSAADGTFLFTTLSAGTYTLTQAPPAGFAQTQPASGGYTITLASGGSSLNNIFGDFQGTLTGSLSGLVFNDLNGNGTMDPGEPGMGGVTVSLVPPPPGFGSVVSGPDGSFRFDGLPFGTWTLAEIVPSGFTQTAPPPPGRITATLDISHPNVPNLLFGNQAPLSSLRIFGSVFVDVNGNGVLDAGEGPQAGVTVQLVNTGSGQTLTTTTAADGTYLFDGLSAGTYTVSETPPTGFTQTAPPPPGTFTVTGAGGDQKGPFVFGNEPGNQGTGSISGDKWIDFNTNGILDGLDYPIAGIVFVLTDSNGQQRTATSDANGKYSFQNLPPGTYDLKEVLPPGFYQTFPGTKDNPLGYTITLAPGEQKAGFRFLNKC
jgi:SdrD B-like domain